MIVEEEVKEYEVEVERIDNLMRHHHQACLRKQVAVACFASHPQPFTCLVPHVSIINLIGAYSTILINKAALSVACADSLSFLLKLLLSFPHPDLVFVV
jgi:hypothetical protein